jgi:hypothetical protein
MKSAGRSCLLALILSTPAHSTTWLIQPDGSGDAPTIQAGIDSAAVGDDVLLACGAFYETGIRMKSGITLHGTSQQCTILQGANGFTTLLCDSIQNASIEDLELTGGDFRMRVTSAQVDLVRCTISGGNADPTAGRGLHADGSDLNLTDCTFTGNSKVETGFAAANGAGLYSNAGHVSLVNCIFQGNDITAAVGLGAGMFSLNSTVDADGCDFRDNSSQLGPGQSTGGADGGGLAADSSTVTLRNCAFSGNLTIGGSDSGRGAGASLRWCPSVTIEDVRFLDNQGGDGTSIFLNGCPDVTVRRCTFLRNKGREGVTVWANNTVALVDECTFDSNDAYLNGVFYARGEFGVVSDVLVVRCTWHSNKGAPPGRPATVYAGPFGGYITIQNSILAKAVFGQAVDCHPSQVAPQITCSDIWGNEGGDFVGCIAGALGTDGNFSSDPLFCSRGSSLYLQWDSPCLPAHSGGCGQVGAFGPGGCNGVSVTPESWGRVKERYRDAVVGQ